MGAVFQKAERRRAFLNLAVTGPSGSGKTYTALLLAKGIAGDGRVAVIDTENDSASLYAGDPDLALDFDVMPLAPPYTVAKYIEGFEAAIAAGYAVLVVDSISHAWAGTGGLLEQVDKLQARSKNKFAAWAPATEQHERFRAAILESRIDMICTMRSKTEHVQTKDQNGETTIKKLGLAPIQREGMDYEFTVVFDMDAAHTAQISKTRVKALDGQVFTPSVKTGIFLADWRNGATLEAAPPRPKAAPTPTPSSPPAPAARPAASDQAAPRQDGTDAGPVRVNKYAKPCEDCGEVVAEKAGLLTNEFGKWVTRHTAGGCPPKAAAAVADPNAPDPQNVEIEALVRQKGLTAAMVKVQVARLGCAVDDQCDWRQIAVVDKVRLLDVLRSLPAQPAVAA